MKTLIGIGIGCSALALSAVAAPSAQAAHYPLDTVSAQMMSADQAATLGVAAKHVRLFSYLTGAQQSAGTIWLCDQQGSDEVEVAAPAGSYEVHYASSKSRVETSAGQELYEFLSESAARDAMKSLRKAAQKCSGSFTTKDDQGWTITQKVSNGQGTTSDGDGFVWIKHVTTATEAGSGLADHEYDTFRRVGVFIQSVEVDSAGVNAPKVTSAQVKQVNVLTGTLGAYWAW